MAPKTISIDKHSKDCTRGRLFLTIHFMCLGACLAERQTKGNIRPKGPTMFIQPRNVLSIIIALAVVSVAWAKDGGVPILDIQKHCQTDKRASQNIFGNNNTDSLDACVKGEQNAREKLVKDWANISASDKSMCVQQTAFSPSYFEWLACIDTSAYVKQMRKDHPVSMSFSQQCPFVTWLPNGSISSVVPCGLMRPRHPSRN